MGLGLDARIYEDKKTGIMKTRRHGIKRQGDWETRRYEDGDYKNIKTRRHGNEKKSA